GRRLSARGQARRQPAAAAWRPADWRIRHYRRARSGEAVCRAGPYGGRNAGRAPGAAERPALATATARNLGAPVARSAAEPGHAGGGSRAPGLEADLALPVVFAAGAMGG